MDPRWPPVTAQAPALEVDTSAATFMSRVYRWMVAGLGVTALVALYTATNLQLLGAVYTGRWVLIAIELGLVFGLSGMAHRLSAAVAGAMFLVYAAVNGLLFSTLFFVYQVGSIGQAFVLTAGAFGALSLYGTVTRKNLDAWRTFLFMGLVGVVLASLVGMFWPSPGFSFVLSCATVVVFAGLTAYDTQKLRRLHGAGYAGGVAALPIVGALTLYLDFVNLFLALLRLFGRRR